MLSLSEDNDIRSVYDNDCLYKYAPPAGDNSVLRGRLRKETHWASAEGPKQYEKEMYYSCNAIGSALNYVYTNLAVCYVKTEHVFRYPVVVDEIERTYDTDTGECIETVTHRTFNSHGQEKKVSVTESHTGDSIIIENAYGYEHSPNNQFYNHFRGIVDSREVRRTGVSGGIADRKNYFYDQQSMNPYPTKITDNGRTTTIRYGSHFRPVRIENPGGRWKEFRWSADGRYLLDVTENDEANTTSYTWLDLIGLGSVSLPSGQSESYSYDGRKRLCGRHDTDGETTVSYEYNLVNEE